MQRVTTAVLLSLCLVAACASKPKGWDRMDGSTSQGGTDQAQCEYEAKLATASYHSTPDKKGESARLGTAIGDGILIAEKRVELVNECMRLKGYAPR